MRVACAIFQNLSEADSAEVMWLSQQGSDVRVIAPQWWQRRLAVACGSAFAALCVAGALLFFVPQTHVEARTNALLEESIHAQADDAAMQHYRMKVGASTCPHEGELQRVAESGISCFAAATSLKQTAWASGNPLSAKTFQAWRSEQAHPKDRLTEQASGWMIETTSDQGEVQRATLRLRSSDHHVAELVLQFRDVADEVQFVEDDVPSTDAIATANPLSESKATTLDGDNPADVLEVHAWSALHDATADSVWDASVVRDGQTVRVTVAAGDEKQRQQVLHALGGLSQQGEHIKTVTDSLRDMPKRAFSGNGPALAEQWVAEHYPESSRQTVFKSEAARLSRDVLGRALWIERMESRRNALQGCSCAATFSTLLAAERSDLSAAEMQLAKALQPLAGQSAAHKPLNAADARALDLSVQELLISSNDGKQEDGMQRQLAVVQKMLQIPSK